MSILCLTKGLSLIDIDAIWLLSLVYVDEDHSKHHTLYWLPKLHKRPYKSRFIANFSPYTTTELSIILASCLTAIKNHVIKDCETVFERNGKNLFWSIENSGELLNKLKSKCFSI